MFNFPSLRTWSRLWNWNKCNCFLPSLLCSPNLRVAFSVFNSNERHISLYVNMFSLNTLFVARFTLIPFYSSTLHERLIGESSYRDCSWYSVRLTIILSRSKVFNLSLFNLLESLNILLALNSTKPTVLLRNWHCVCSIRSNFWRIRIQVMQRCTLYNDPIKLNTIKSLVESDN